MEMEEMRQQIAILKEKLAKQEIVNEKIILKTIEEKMQTINRDKIRVRVLNVFSLIFCTLVFAVAGFPIWCVIATVVILSVCLFGHEWAYKDIDNNLGNVSLIEMRKNAVHVASTNAKWLKIGFCLSIPWLGALLYADYQIVEDYQRDFFGYIAAIYVVGAVIGGLIGYNIYRKQQKHVKNLIREIDNYTESEQ